MENKMYKERMLIEFEELVDKISKAKNYFDSNSDDELLSRQIEAMEEYKNALAVRILKEMNRY